MAARFSEGTVLLVAGHPIDDGDRRDEAVEALGHIGELLLASAPAWQIRRLSPAIGERYAPHRVSLKHHVDWLAQQRVRVAMLVIVAGVAEAAGEPALITEARYREYPEDATLPLSSF